MQRLTISAIVLMLCLISLFLISANIFRAEAAELPCLECHASKKAGKTLHQAIEMGCSTCHVAPHKEEKPVLDLISAVPDLCFQCHDSEEYQKKSVHAPVAAGMCTACHNPHSSDSRKLLSGTLPDICYGCHDRSMFSKRVLHGPVAEGSCTICHNPHSADYEYNLVSPEGELCLMCHSDKSSGRHVLAGFSLGDVHPVSGKPDPSRQGREISCISCHLPHSSDQRALLSHGGINAENLCMLCHEKSSMRFF